MCIRFLGTPCICHQRFPVAVRSKAWVCGRSPAEIVGSDSAEGMEVCCKCCVLSGRGLCDGLITCTEESYRMLYVIVCDLENLVNGEAMARVGPQRHRNIYIYRV